MTHYSSFKDLTKLISSIISCYFDYWAYFSIMLPLTTSNEDGNTHLRHFHSTSYSYPTSHLCLIFAFFAFASLLQGDLRGLHGVWPPALPGASPRAHPCSRQVRRTRCCCSIERPFLFYPSLSSSSFLLFPFPFFSSFTFALPLVIISLLYTYSAVDIVRSTLSKYL